MNEFGKRITDLRKSKGLTQEALAECLGVTAQAVSKWERGESMPDVALLPRLAQIFEVSIDSLFDMEQKPVATYLPEARRDFDKMVLRVLVEDGADRVKVNLPLVLIKATLEIGLSSESFKFGKADLSSIDFASIIQLIENGAVGRIVEVESDDGSKVIVEVI